MFHKARLFVKIIKYTNLHAHKLKLLCRITISVWSFFSHPYYEAAVPNSERE